MAGTFDVQHCDVHTDHTSYILVECTFAINSTGSVNITDLPTGEYRVTVYDQFGDTSPAYRQHQLIQLVTHIFIKPTAAMSTSLFLNSSGNKMVHCMDS